MFSQNRRVVIFCIFEHLYIQIQGAVIAKKYGVFPKRMPSSFGSGFPIGAKAALLAHDFALQSVVCYTFADGAGVKICCSLFLSNIFSQTAKLQRDGRMPPGCWRTVRPVVICGVGKWCICSEDYPLSNRSCSIIISSIIFRCSIHHP